MSAKFKYGDRVLAGNHAGTVTSVRQDGGYYVCNVKFDNDQLIPPDMDYNEMYLSFANTDNEICPICKTRWTVSKFNMHVWKDCKKCGLTSEDCVKIHADSKKSGLSFAVNNKLKSEDDLLKEFQKMLDKDDDKDDQEDFGFYHWGV